MRPRLFRSVLVASAAAAMCVSASVVAASTASATTVSTRLVEPAVSAPAGSRALGTINAGATLHFDVYLTSRSAAGLDAYTAAVTNRRSIHFGRYLAPGEFARRFGASPASIARVAGALRADGLSVSSSLVDGLGLKVSGRASVVEHTFSTSISRYRLADGSVGTAAVSGVRLPTSIASSVLSVIGLNNLVHPTTNIIRPSSHIKWPTVHHTGRSFSSHPSGIAGAPSSCASATEATQQGYGGITDDQVAQSYGADGLYGAGDFGAGQTIAVYELEPFALSDVAGFDECYFASDNTSNITTINVDGGPGVGAGSGESALDIENVSAMAPQAKIDVYQAPNSSSGALDAYGQIVSNDTANVVTTSWGLCETEMSEFEPGSLAVEHMLFEQAAAQGQTVFASAGDDGSDDCANHSSSPVAPNLSVDDPASQPYVVSVGGTTAITLGQSPTEQVWNDGATGGAGGGGTSRLWAMPSWQKNVPSVLATASSKICGTGTTQCRVTPDVSAFADEYTGITIEIDGGWYTIGGTSSSAPMWAGLLAEINESSTCQSSAVTHNGVGFASPLLYEVGANPTLAAESFNDVTTGNNDIFSNDHGAYAATTGYDAASGFGTPNLTGRSLGQVGLATTLCTAAQEATTSALTSVSPTSGPTTGNTTVTIHGTGFKTGSTSNVKGVSFGDFPAASFTVTSSTTIVAKTAPAGVPKLLGKAVAAGTESLVEVTYTSGHIAAGPTYSYLAVTKNKELPTVLSVGPTGGPSAGGNTVSIYGTGFAGATKVTFGGVAATSFVVKSDSLIEAVAPSSATVSCLAISHTSASGLCQTQVVVTGPSGSSVVIPALKPLQGNLDYNLQGVPYAPPNCKCEIFPTLTEYDYQTTATISKLIDLSATKAAPLAYPGGGDGFVAEGTGFNWLTLDYLTFGDGSQAQNQDFSIFSVSYRAIEFIGLPDTSPSPSGNESPVSVVSEGGTSAGANVSYGGVPMVTSVSDQLLPSAGGTQLQLYGQGFTGATQVEFVSPFNNPSTLILKNFTVNSSTRMTVLSPSLVPGSYVISVDNLYGNSTTYDEPLIGTPTSYETQPLSSSNVAVVYPGGAAITTSEIVGSSSNSCSITGGCTMLLIGQNLDTGSPITAYVGTQPATVDTQNTLIGYDEVSITVPPALFGVAGPQEVFLTTGNGATADTVSAIVNYI